MFEASSAVTVRKNAVSAGSGVTALTTKCVAGPETAMPALVLVYAVVDVSAAVIDWLPLVFSVALNEPVPLVSVESVGRLAAPSELVKWTVPA